MSTSYKVTTTYGKITVSDSTLSQTIADIVEKKKGVYITNSKGKRLLSVYKTMGASAAGNIDVEIIDNKVSVKVYIAIKFGMSISAVTENIIESIRKEINTIIGENPKKITVVITGVISRKFASRNIEVVKIYDDEQ